MILNQSKDPLTDYRLSLTTRPLAGKYKVVTLPGEGKLTSPVISERGGFKDYVPRLELPASARISFQLQKK
jgi:hypothetical protein